MSTEVEPTIAPSRRFIIASRSSKLAQVQTNSVHATLQSFQHKSYTFATSFVSNEIGDVNKTDALYTLGGKSVWTKELEVALVDNEVDFLVHSLKDVPTVLPEGCILGAICEREDPVDSLIVKSGQPWNRLEDLPEGSVVGTGSIRRVAQLKRGFPHLKFLGIRGNIDTRLAKLDDPAGPYSAIILAKAGLVRMNWQHRITSDLGPPTLYHAVSQGALGIEIRNNDPEALALCRKITHWQTEWRCLAERACLRLLEGGCSVPVGIHTVLNESTKELLITGCVTSLDGGRHVQRTVKEQVKSSSDAEALGEKLAGILIDNGAKGILDEINEAKAKVIEKLDM